MRASAPCLLLSAVAISACSEIETTNIDGYNAARSDIAGFISEEATNTASRLTAAPAENSARMTGVFSIDAPWTQSSTDGVLGQINMRADFASKTISGNLHSMVEAENITGASSRGTDISGDIAFSGTLDVMPGIRDDISASGSGTIQSDSGGQVTIASQFNGDIYRRPVSGDLAARGYITGTANSRGTTYAVQGDYFAAE